MKRATWFDHFMKAATYPRAAGARVREALAKLDDELFELWNLGENVLLAWTRDGEGLRVLPVRHYEIAEAIHGISDDASGVERTPGFINEILAGPRHLEPAAFHHACRVFGVKPRTIPENFSPGVKLDAELTENLFRRYGVSLVRGRAVVLMDAVKFSLYTPLEQVAMLNSLAYSVNSAYRQLLSKDIQVNFARTTTGDGFYIWNRSRTPESNIALYKLMMMILADNAVAQSKARGSWVPKLRAAFHVGEHYEFYQVEALNPTTFSYIVGHVTIELSRIIEKALPGQVLLGDFGTEVGDVKSGQPIQCDTLEFVERTAATLDQLNGLEVSGDRVDSIRCYLTGQNRGGPDYAVNRYHVLDKHGLARAVYNAKINIHRKQALPIYLGLRSESLGEFSTLGVDELDRGTLV
jgi:hypothetical protein